MRKIFLFLAACAMSIGTFAASITASDVDFGSVVIKGQTLPVTGSKEVHVTFSGLQQYSSLMAEVVEGDDNFYLEVYSMYYGTATFVDYPVYYYLESAGTFTGKVRFYGYDNNSNEFEKIINVKVVATDEVDVPTIIPFERINSTSELKAGDVIAFVNEQAAAVGGPLNGSYMQAVTEGVKINTSTGKATFPETTQMFELSKSGDNWQLANTATSQKLLSNISGKGGFSYGTPSADFLVNWAISVSNGVASVTTPDGTFPVEFNVDRFKPYKSAGSGTDIALYRKTGDPQEVQSAIVLEPSEINFGETALDGTKALEISYTGEYLTDDIIWGIEGADAALFEVEDEGNRTSGTVTITYKGTGTNIGDVDARLSYLTQDIKLDPLNGSFPIHINLVEFNGISFKQATYNVLKDESLDLSGEVVFNPTTVANKEVTWKFNKTQYFATLSEDGVFTSTVSGDFIIIATSVLDGTKTAQCTVRVSLPVPASIELGATEHEMNIGDTWTLEATVKPDGTEKKAKFVSDNTAVATVSSKGVITAKTLGTAIITVSAEDYPDVKNTCTITVVKRTVESITFADEEMNLNLGSSVQLNPIITPAAAADEYPISYESSNPEVATVDANGKVSSVAVGDAVITATISDKSAQITIHVVAAATFAKVTDASQIAVKDTIILALHSVPVIAGAQDGKKLTVLLEDVTVTETEAYADDALRLVVGTIKNKSGFSLQPVGSDKVLAENNNDLYLEKTTSTKNLTWQFVADGNNGIYVQNVGNANAMFKYHAGNKAIKPYKSNTTGAVFVYVYIRKYQDPQGIEDVNAEVKAQKILREGQILILRNGETFSITGARVP